MNLADLQLITLDHFWSMSLDPVAQAAFIGMIALRRQGYGPDYPEEFIPMDAADAYCRHHLVCQIRPGQAINVLAGFRQVPLSRSRFHHDTLPLLQTAIKATSPSHVKALETLFNHHKDTGTDCLYGGGLTIQKELRQNREFSLLFREIVGALNYSDWLEHPGSSVVTGAVMRFGTPQWFQAFGFEALTQEGQELTPLKKVSAGGEPMLLMVMRNPTLLSRQLFEKFSVFLENRLWLSAKQKSRSHKEAA